MTQLQLFTQQRLPTILLALVLGGFLTTVIELLMTDHRSGAQTIGLYSAVFGTVLVVHGILGVVQSGLRAPLQLNE